MGRRARTAAAARLYGPDCPVLALLVDLDVPDAEKAPFRDSATYDDAVRELLARLAETSDEQDAAA